MSAVAPGDGSPKVRVALDAMGGDSAPAAAVAGALMASADGVDVVLVGDEARLTPLLDSAGVRLPVVHAAEAVDMGEEPALALRSKRDTSIRRAAALVASGEAAALVSAGSTGATLAAALLEIGRQTGVRRPAIGADLPGGVVLVDAGGSSEVQPEALFGYARIGSAYARARGVDSPSVGLLNVGAEPGRGSAMARAAFALLSDLDSFAGNVEPDAVLAGKVDVVVTDGFTGNIFIKALEAAAGPAVGPSAAVLLGCSRPVLIAHGAAGPQQVAAALATARDVATAGLVERLGAELAATERVGEPAGG